MHATFIEIAVLMPGLIMDAEQAKRAGAVPAPGPNEIEMIGTRENDGFAFADCECVRLYSVERNLIVKLEDIAVDSVGILTETIVGFRSGGRMIEPFAEIGGTWDGRGIDVFEYMAEGSWDDLDADTMAELWKQASAVIAAARASELEAIGRRYFPPHLERVTADAIAKMDAERIKLLGWPAIWTARVGSRSWEEGGGDELEGFDYAGPAKIVLA